MTLFAIDIETVANSRAQEYYDKKYYSPPANYKDTEKIKKFLADKRHSDRKKAGLSWWTGKVICVCLINIEKLTTHHFSGGEETVVLRELFNFLDDSYATLIGKSSEDFDIPFLIGRGMVNNLPIPDTLKPWNHERIRDVDHIFSRSAVCQQRSTLNDYAWGLGIAQKISEGSQVQAMYDETLISNALSSEAKWSEIRAYCMRDTQIVAEMIKRFTKEKHKDPPAIPF